MRTELGIETHATVAIGDGENDIEMLDWATAGFAMAHALVPMLAAATALRSLLR